MNNLIDNRKIILFLTFVLIIIIGFISFLNLIKKNYQPNNLLISPTYSYNNQGAFFPNKNSTKNIPSQIKNNIDNKNSFQKEVLPKIKIFSKEEQQKVNQFMTRLPLNSENYSVNYSPLFNRFYFLPKNNQGKIEIERLIKENQLEELIKKYPEIFIINENLSEKEIEKERENYLNNMNIENRNLLIPSPSLSSNINKQQITIAPSIINAPNSFSPLVEILRPFYKMGDITLSSTIIPTPFSPSSLISPSIVSYPSIFNPPTYNDNNFTQLFNEVGSKVGVPPKILAAVMTIESPSTFNLSPEQINLYSKPNNVIPQCGPNICSATGPMQMTIGVDNTGSSRCLGCGLTSCPNAWARYGNAINIFTNASHNPNPCNLLDNVYAAAFKLKTDSGANDPVNWTQEQVYRAGTRYYGSCADKYRYTRLGNRTYCEFLWWFYTRN